MIPNYLSETFTSYAPVLGDHLWQSTLFALASGALTVFLRNNRARARYWLWLAASLKFLVPFSVLVGIGSHLAWTRFSVAGTGIGLYFAMEEVSQPFTQAVVATPVISRAGTSAVLPGLIHWLPFLLAAVWLCGFVAVLAVWGVRWRKISASIRGAVLLPEGREVELLRRIERISGMQQPIKMLLSSSSLEPGIFGIAHPTLLWPQGISEHLEDAHLEAILAHEVWHARRRDNLTAAIHMLVEGLFWFHPLVWWLGARLVDERERACDEGVLELGSERQAYAESILKTCEFCVGSALACVSGVTGADLKKRIVHIMTRPVVHKLRPRKKALLGVAGIVAVAAPIMFGLVSTTPQSASPKAEDAAGKTFTYEVASIKPEKSGGMMFRVLNTPDGFTADTTVQMLIRIAYGIEDNQISGAPGWVNSDKYDVEAKMDQATANEVRKLSEDQQEPARQRMLQALLADRLKLTIHRETKELPIYSLVIAKGGPKLHEAKPGDTYPNGIKGPDGRPGSHLMRMGRGELTAQSLGLAQLAHLLSEQMGRTVIDNTGLKRNYDFTLKWTPDQSTPMLNGATGSDSAPLPDSGPSIFTAIQEQLGLKLESQKGPVEMLVVDRVEKPSEN